MFLVFSNLDFQFLTMTSRGGQYFYRFSSACRLIEYNSSITSSNRSSSYITRSSDVTDSGNHWVFVSRLQTGRYGEGKFNPRSGSTDRSCTEIAIPRSVERGPLASHLKDLLSDTHKTITKRIRPWSRKKQVEANEAGASPRDALTIARGSRGMPRARSFGNDSLWDSFVTMRIQTLKL